MSARDLIDGFDLESYLHKHGGQVTTQHHEWTVQCPTCGKDDKLVVNTAKKTWHCWICEEYKLRTDGKRVPVRGAGGLIALIQALEGCTRERAVMLLVDQSAHVVVAIDQVAAVIDYAEHESIRPAPAIAPPDGWQPIEYTTLPYLHQRGILREDVVEFGLVYCTTGRYAGRLVFPVWEGGQLVYYQARATWEERPGDRRYIKSLNPPRVEGMASPTEVLLNLDKAKKHRRVIVTEGPIDCIHAGSAAVCTFGKHISMTQALKLRFAGVQALDLMWDGPSDSEPSGAWPEMVQAASMLAGLFNDVRLVFLPRGDPGDYDRQELETFRAQARPAASVSRLAMI